MDTFDLELGYSTGEIPGKCIKCLAEQELNNCLRILLTGEGENREVQQYEMLVSFLKSPESRKLHDESVKYLAEGERVTLKLSFANGKPEYELEVIQSDWRGETNENCSHNRGWDYHQPAFRSSAVVPCGHSRRR